MSDDSGSTEGERGNKDPGIVTDLARLGPSIDNGGGPIASRLDRAYCAGRVSAELQFTFTDSSLEAGCRWLPERWRLRFRWLFDAG